MSGIMEKKKSCTSTNCHRWHCCTIANSTVALQSLMPPLVRKAEMLGEIVSLRLICMNSFVLACCKENCFVRLTAGLSSDV